MSARPAEGMDSAATRCAHCKEELGEGSVKKGSKLYCCAACAFEAERRKQCQPDCCTLCGPDSLRSRGNQV